jgi:biopolymer transport protein ExbB
MARVLNGSAIGRGGAWAAFAALTLAYLVLMPAPGLRAQEAKDGAKAEPAAEAKEAPAAAPAADAAAAPAPAEASKKSQRNLLQWAIDASGPIGLFLLCLSVYFVALIIKLFLELRVSEAVPADLVEKLEVAIKDKKFQEAYDACKDNDSFLARLVRTGVANLPNGRAEAKEAMAAVQDEVVTMMETRISYLAIIGTLGPMIGLVGTIAGMIASFQEIANAVGAQPRPDKVAEGISTALFITLEGVSLSVPAIFFFAFFRNRIAQITLETAKVADRTITSLLNAAKQAKTA